MKGLELARAYYERFGRPMLEESFSAVSDRIAAGLVGEGSECLGFDDALSRDHDFEPGFCLFLTREDEREFGFRLERAYAKLPAEFEGVRRSCLSPVGGARHGVIVIEDFYRRFLGSEEAPREELQWLYTPSSALLAASNGAVFCDPLGRFSAVRELLLGGYPEDVRRKKLAAHTVFMAQAGPYNYNRCIRRGECGAAQLALFDFVRHAISAVYLINNQYEPFYKWAYRGMRELPLLSSLESTFTTLTELDNSAANVALKGEILEDVAGMLIAEFRAQGLTEAKGAELEAHAYSVQNGIQSATLRQLHIMEGG